MVSSVWGEEQGQYLHRTHPRPKLVLERTFELFSFRLALHERIPKTLWKHLFLKVDGFERRQILRFGAIAVGKTGEIALLSLL